MSSDADHDLEATRTFALWAVRYFERLDAATHDDTWRLGAETAREWARLIGAPSPSARDISSLIHVVYVNRRRSTMWDLMALGVYSWATERGYTVPAFDDFYASPPAAPPPGRAWLRKIAATLHVRLRKGLTRIWPAA